jgi:polysaccharide export outer membrane protein
MVNARLKCKAVWSSFALAASIAASPAAAEVQSAAAQPSNGGAAAATAPAPPADYVVGPNDLLSVVFWREPEMSGQVRVRPDGRISVPLLNDVPAVGLTPDQLRRQLEQAAKKFIAEPNATVVVLEINSRSVFVVGQVATPGVYPLNTPMNVLQALAAAGGLLEFADGKNIVVERNAGGRKERLRFSYPDVVKGKRVEENVALKPGDTVIVP